jgi:protein phosphatase
MFFVADGCSDCGQVREHNEDSYRVDCDRGLFVVADGMGGHAAGEIASALAVESIFGSLTGDEGDHSFCREDRLRQAISEANQTVFEDAQAHSERKGMGTTLTFMCWNGECFHFGHVGDSRAYRLRNNELEQLTRDHTWVNMQVRAGLISEEEALNAQMRHVLVNALGTQAEVDADIIPIDIRSSDRYLLCSDGLSDLVGHNDLMRILSGKGSPGEIAARLIDLANALGGKDNITAVVVDCLDAKWKSKLKTAVNKLRR